MKIEAFLVKSSLPKQAFTLAEVLVSMAVIGVIAAMTIPTLITRYTNHTYVSGAKKAYNVLQTALTTVPITEGCSSGDYSCTGMTDVAPPSTSTMARQFKTVKIYTENMSDTQAACQHVSQNNNAGCFYTQDGMVISSYSGNVPAFIVDINGPKGPNHYGRDIFYYGVATVPRDGIAIGTVLPEGSKGYARYFDRTYWNENPQQPNCRQDQLKSQSTFYIASNQELGCTARVIDENEMKYWSNEIRP